MVLLLCTIALEVAPPIKCPLPYCFYCVCNMLLALELGAPAKQHIMKRGLNVAIVGKVSSR